MDNPFKYVFIDFAVPNLMNMYIGNHLCVCMFVGTLNEYLEFINILNKILLIFALNKNAVFTILHIF